MLTDSQISAAIAYLDAPGDVDNIELESYKAGAEQLRKQVMRLERQRDNARFLVTVLASAATALAWIAWWPGR